MNNIVSLIEIIDTLPKIKIYNKDWLEGIGLKAVERVNAEFFELQEKILKSKKKLLEHWREEIIEEFENDSEIYNRFNNQYQSFINRMKARYRSDIKQISSLLLEDTKNSYDVITTKLKYVEQHYKLMSQFKDNERKYIENMDALYDGLNTEKDDIQKNMQALRGFKEQCEVYGLTAIQMGQLLTLKTWLVTEFFDRNVEIKSAIEYVKDVYPKIHIQLKGHNDLESQTFEQLKEGISSKLPIAKGLIQQIKTVESILKVEQQFIDFMQTTLDIELYHKSLNSYENNFAEYEQRYGGLFTGIDTDWEQLSGIVAWWKDIKIHLLNNKISSDNIQSLNKFVQNYNGVIATEIAGNLQGEIKRFEGLLQNLSNVVSSNLINQIKSQPFSTLEELLNALNTRVTTILSTLEKIQALRKDKWFSAEQLMEEVENIYEYETILNVMKQHANRNDSVLYIAFDLSNEGFEDVKNRIVANQKFINELEKFEFTYESPILQCIKNISVNSIEKLNGINMSVFELNQYFQPLLAKFNSHTNLLLKQHIELIEQMLDSTYEIEKIVRIKSAFKHLSDFGLSIMIQKILENKDLWNVSPKRLFLKRYYENALDEVYEITPNLINFNKDNYERIIDLFKQMDTKQFSENAKRLSVMLRDNLEETLNKAESRVQLSLLINENERKKGHLPLRQLFSKIPDILLSLKPCVLMSPLSVCEFLDPRKIQFDLVVFDEASQICPEDAIAPMIRGRNIIMAGDSKQMPPTNFFKATASVEDDYDDDEYREEEEYESVLGLCSDLLPQKTLKWHYRSKHESLIAFSNRHFYSNALNTFPSAENQSGDLGVKFEYVENGYFDRSGSKTNPIEAERVAQLIVEHYKQSNASLGVITFNQHQMDAIERKLEAILKAQPELENLIYTESVEEPFFIKNIENVQGDERDVIFLSVGYAKDQNGVFSHHFGPLNNAGGERRLNVAITRAKKKLVVISSMKDSEINSSNTQSTGRKLFKNYLEYARTGQIPESVYVNSELEFDSPLEKDIYDSIVSLGYEVKTQVGTSGYRIDLAVVHPMQPGKFIVGIECDGASYHSSKTARDRDRLRQQVLEGLGWKIYRIWSQDWFKNKAREIEKIKIMLKQEVK